MERKVYLKSQVEISRLKKSEHIIIKNTLCLLIRSQSTSQYFLKQSLSLSHKHTHISLNGLMTQKKFTGKDAEAPLG